MKRLWSVVLSLVLLGGVACTEPLEGGIQRPSAATLEDVTASPGIEAPALTLSDLQSAVDRTLDQVTGRYRLEVRESHGPTSGDRLVEAVGSFDIDQRLFDVRYVFSYVRGPGWGPGTKLDPHARVIIDGEEAFVHGPDGEGRLTWQRHDLSGGGGPRVELEGEDTTAAPPPLHVLRATLSISPVDDVKEWPEFTSYEVEVDGLALLHVIESAWMFGYLEGLPARELRRIFRRPGTAHIGLDDRGMVRSFKTTFDSYFLSAIGASLRRGDVKLKRATESIDYLETYDLVCIAWIHDLGDDVKFILPDLDDIRGQSV